MDRPSAQATRSHASPLLRNPLVHATILQRDGQAARLELSSYSHARGFVKVALDRGEEPTFDTALRLVASPDEPVPQLESGPMLALWAAGLLVMPQERVDAAVPQADADTIAAFRANGFVDVPPCIPPAMRTALVQHYGRLLQAGQIERNTTGTDRYTAHNDPGGRIVQKLLAPLVAAIVGGPIKPSYTFASLYCGGAQLPVHRDRAQCEYTLSLLIEHSPDPVDGVSPWAVQLFPEEGEPPIECRQRTGGGLLFRGREIAHGRQALPADERCWVLLLHYVDAAFDGALN